MDAKIHLKLQCSLSKQLSVSVPWDKWRGLRATADLGEFSFPFCPFVEMVHKSRSQRKESLLIAILHFFCCPLLCSSLLSNSCRLLLFNHTWTSVLQQNCNGAGAAQLGLPVVSCHGHPRHWEHLSWESTISLWGLSLGSLLEGLRQPQWWHLGTIRSVASISGMKDCLGDKDLPSWSVVSYTALEYQLLLPALKQKQLQRSLSDCKGK